MLKVVKRDGRILDFDPEKIKTSVENSANDSHIQIMEKELELVARAVQKNIEKVRGADGITSSYEIRGAIVRVLKELGYKNIARDFYDREKGRKR